MIVLAEVGSLASDRLQIDGDRWPWVTPLVLGASILGLVAAAPAAPEAAVALCLLSRSLVTILLTAPISFLLGLCFPTGFRVIERSSREVGPWMWGVNGALSLPAVAISMRTGIHANQMAAGFSVVMWMAAACYAVAGGVLPSIAGSSAPESRRNESATKATP